MTREAQAPNVKREADSDSRSASANAPAAKRARPAGGEGDQSEAQSAAGSDTTADGDEKSIWTRSARDLLHADEEQSEESGEKRIDDYLSGLFF